MSLTALRNLANTDFASGTGITASTLRTVISAILDVFSKNITYSASIPFNCGASNMGQQILSANTVFTVNSTDATPGMCTILRLQGDGTHTPDLTAFKVIEGAYVNTSGTNNLLLFCFDGTDYTVSIKQIPSTGGTGAGDTTPPVLTGISVLNSAPSQVVLQYSETLGAVTPASGDFSFPTGGGTISSVVISGSQVLINLSAPIASGTTNTLTYTPGTNKIQDTSGNLAASFTAHSITNSVGGGTAPSVIGINVHDATSIDVGFDMSVTGGLGGWSFTKNGSSYVPASISSPAAATLRFTFSSNMIAGDTLLSSYNSGTGNTQNGSSVPLASFTNHSVTNGLSSSDTTLTWRLISSGIATNGSNGLTFSGTTAPWTNTAESNELFTNGQSFKFQFTNDANRQIVGLTSFANYGGGFSQMDIGLFKSSATQVDLVINGVTLGTLQTIPAGAYIKITINNTNFVITCGTDGVTYGTTLYTNSKLPWGPYYASISFDETGGIVNQMLLNGTAAPTYTLATWLTLGSGSAVDFTGLKRTGSTVAGWTQPDIANQTISNGECVDWMADGDTQQKFIGLCSVNNPADYTVFNFAMLFTGASVGNIYESGSAVGSPTIPAINSGDVLRIAFKAGAILYQRSTDLGNTFTTIYTSAVTPSGSYFIVDDMRFNGSILHKVKKQTAP